MPTAAATPLATSASGGSELKQTSFTPSNSDLNGKRVSPDREKTGITRVSSSPMPGRKSPGRRKQKMGDSVKLAPMQTRSTLSENYEKPRTGREDWWRSTIRETPAPGAYEMHDFLSDLTTRPNTYRFKSDGRKVNPSPQIGRGETLMPGAYEFEDVATVVQKKKMSYGFKNTTRDSKDFLNFGKKDKDVNVPPNVYDMEKHLSMTVERSPSKFWQFKSQSQRFPTTHFKPKEGPAPGNYESSREPSTLHTVSSSFKSKTPRFSTSHTRVPGPGTYDKAYQSPSAPNTITKMGRIHGIFFSSAFQA